MRLVLIKQVSNGFQLVFADDGKVITTVGTRRAAENLRRLMETNAEE